VPILDDLTNGYIRQFEGVLHGVGVLVDECYYERSSDHGATKSIVDGASATKVKVTDCDGGCRPAVEVYQSGAELEVILENAGATETWATRDNGRTWTQVTAP